jgi:large subunit ribosomal protein L35
MSNKCKPGRLKTQSGAKKRFKVTGTGKLTSNKPAHRHLLQQKSKRQKRLHKKSSMAPAVYAKQLKRQLPGM